MRFASVKLDKRFYLCYIIMDEFLRYQLHSVMRSAGVQVWALSGKTIVSAPAGWQGGRAGGGALKAQQEEQN